jgi:hypothetical protein
MIDNGVVWIDEQNHVERKIITDDIIYWFPGLMNKL